jgi:hypothetical protein
MTANTCQCEHCLEIIRQQKRMQAWQKLKNPISNIDNHPHQVAYQGGQVMDFHDLLTTPS